MTTQQIKVNPVPLMDRLFKLGQDSVEWVQVNLDQYYQDESKTVTLDMKDVKQQEALLTSLQSKLSQSLFVTISNVESKPSKLSKEERLAAAYNYNGNNESSFHMILIFNTGVE